MLRKYRNAVFLNELALLGWLKTMRVVHTINYINYKLKFNIVKGLWFKIITYYYCCCYGLQLHDYVFLVFYGFSFCSRLYVDPVFGAVSVPAICSCLYVPVSMLLSSFCSCYPFLSCPVPVCVVSFAAKKKEKYKKSATSRNKTKSKKLAGVLLEWIPRWCVLGKCFPTFCPAVSSFSLNLDRVQ